MKPSEIRELGTTELAEALNDSYQELRNLRFQQATRQLQNTARFRFVHQDIARIKTILRERELAGAIAMTETATAPPPKGRQKEFVGRVVSNKMEKTVVVAVEKTAPPPALQAHDPPDEASTTPTTRATACRSATRCASSRRGRSRSRSAGASPRSCARPRARRSRSPSRRSTPRPTTGVDAPTGDAAAATADEQEEA